MKIAAAYIRVSTDEQTELSPDSQIKQIRMYAKAHDMIVPEEFVFADEGISGKNTVKRPAFNAMIGIAKTKPKPFDAILLWKFSRFARNRQDSIVYKSLLRKQLGIEVISITESLGDDKISILIEALIEAMDEYYSINLAEEVRRGMKEKVSRGKPVSIAPFGYLNQNGKFVPDPEKAPIVRMIYEDAISGMGYREIAVKLNQLGVRTRHGNKMENRTIEYILRNPVYIGKLRWNETAEHLDRNKFGDSTMIIDAEHEGIISQEMWDKVQELTAERARTNIKYRHELATTHDVLLRGLLRCSSCGGALVYQAAQKGYQCNRYAHGLCDKSHYVSAARINDIVLQYIQESIRLGRITNLNKRKSRPKRNNDVTLQQIKRHEKMLKKAKEAYLAGVDTLEEYRQNKQKITEALEALRRLSPPPETDETADRQEFLAKRRQDIKVLVDPNASEGTKNQVLKSFVEKIVYDKVTESIEIYFYM